MPNTKNTENLAKASISSTINNHDNAIPWAGMRSLGAKIAMYRRWTENEFSARSTNNLWICQSNLSRFHVAKILWTKLHTIWYIMLKMIVWHHFPNPCFKWLYFARLCCLNLKHQKCEKFGQSKDLQHHLLKKSLFFVVLMPSCFYSKTRGNQYHKELSLARSPFVQLRS